LNDIYLSSLQVKPIYRTENLQPLEHTVKMAVVRKKIKEKRCVKNPKIGRLYVTRFICKSFIGHFPCSIYKPPIVSSLALKKSIGNNAEGNYRSTF
jgi:hypothetical protein